MNSCGNEWQILAIRHAKILLILPNHLQKKKFAILLKKKKTPHFISQPREEKNAKFSQPVLGDKNVFILQLLMKSADFLLDRENFLPSSSQMT